MEWVTIPCLVVLALIALLHFDPDERKRRLYEAELDAREPVGDGALAHRFFATGEVAPDVPCKVRKIFAEFMSIPPEKMLPDDDLSFFWDDLMEDLIRRLEEDFGIEISPWDAAQTKCTIRAVTKLVARKTGSPSAS